MKFSIITLGCKVNAYESQYYAGQLEKLGYEQVSPEKACDICIINTCTVTNTAASKSRQKIHYAKRMNPNALCVVVGCFVQCASEEERIMKKLMLFMKLHSLKIVKRCLYIVLNRCIEPF